MAWLLSHLHLVRPWTLALMGVYTVYLGVTIQRNRHSGSEKKLSSSQIAVAVVLLVVGGLLLSLPG
jgi:hypothetical protein